jgi:hypothetical protein
MPNQSMDTVSKGVRFPKWLETEILAIAKREHRDFTKQVIYMLEKYLPYCQEEKRDAANQ